MHQETYLFFWLFITSTSAIMNYDQPYCGTRYRRLCQGKGQHVACEFPQHGPGPLCENYTQVVFTNSVKRFVTSDINRRRQRVASGHEKVRGGLYLPRPQVMMLVEWDRELAFLAQRLADQCNFVHDDCRATVRYPYAGQTVGEVRWRRSSDSDELSAQRAIRRVLDAWWGERRRVHPKQMITPFRLTTRGAVWGHFSQLAIWSLTAVGCGAVRHGRVRSRLLLVCDYSHTNMLGQRTISPGPLAPCPIHTVRRPRSGFPLLCGPVRHQIPADSQEDDPENYEEVVPSEIETSEVHVVTTAQVRLTKIIDEEADRMNTRTDSGRNDMNTGIKLRVIERETTRRIITGNIDQDFDNRDYQRRIISDLKFGDWKSRTPGRGNQDNFEESVRNQKQFVMHDPEEVNVVQHYRPTAKPLEFHTEGLLSRQRWKQTRDRPRRPGANALYNIPVSVIQTFRPSIKSFQLDKDDLDQLFRDTGFYFQSKKKHSHLLEQI